MSVGASVRPQFIFDTTHHITIKFDNRSLNFGPPAAQPCCRGEEGFLGVFSTSLAEHGPKSKPEPPKLQGCGAKEEK